MSKAYDKFTQVRVDPNNRAWLSKLKKQSPYKANLATLANEAMRKGMRSVMKLWK